MKAMLLEKIVSMSETGRPLRPADVPVPEPAPGRVLIKLSACGVCHTELDEIEGRTPPPVLPVIPGHQAVGIVEETGKGVTRLKKGDRVGVAWIFSSCGKCRYCLEGNDNLCPEFRATGRDADGGYAEYMTVGEDYAYKIPGNLTDSEAAPMLCAGAIGYRSLRLTGIEDGQTLGLTGFGASGHLVLKLARFMYPKTDVYVFARSEAERGFARELGAAWTGGTEDTPPRMLDAVIDTTPVWKPVVEALARLAPEGRLVINAIRKEDADKDYLLRLDYVTHLWMEKEIKSVANVSRRDVREFLALASEAGLKPLVEEYALRDANRALSELKSGSIKGAKVLRMV
ncbi:MAG TPA: zinc-dependent alcohol dehydrogenase family protein [Thermodesulfobacteriota bacterium]|nr:zinc-dependent alcohol dehydrogenase family protein [Thermodesulfobacteriota bacterium]